MHLLRGLTQKNLHLNDDVAKCIGGTSIGSKNLRLLQLPVSPSHGRFLSRDTYAYNYQNPIELNRYVYGTNNPINAYDPTGHFAFFNYAGGHSPILENHRALSSYGGAIFGFMGAAWFYLMGLMGQCGEPLKDWAKDINPMLFIGLATAVGFYLGYAYEMFPVTTSLFNFFMGIATVAGAMYDIHENGANVCNVPQLFAGAAGVVGGGAGLIGGGSNLFGGGGGPQLVTVGGVNTSGGGGLTIVGATGAAGEGSVVGLAGAGGITSIANNPPQTDPPEDPEDNQSPKPPVYDPPENIPEKGYRYISSDADYLNTLIETGEIPANSKPEGTYFSYDKYDIPEIAVSRLQLPKNNNARIRIEFYTDQIAHDIRIPYGKYGASPELEPSAVTQNQWGGVGGGSQRVTNSPIKVDKIVDLVTGALLYE